jgi:hypothetical protein
MSDRIDENLEQRQHLGPDELMRARIQERAYHLWEAAGCPDGQADQFWMRAEREIAGSSAPSP